MVSAPVKSAPVNDPKNEGAPGAQVRMMAPKRSGTIIMPPGMRSIDRLMGICTMAGLAGAGTAPTFSRDMLLLGVQLYKSARVRAARRREESHMHRSKLSTFVIDCGTSDIDGAADFWSRALGRPVAKVTPESGTYRELRARPEEPMVLVQQVTHPSRIHLDIESDDLGAEVRRLEALGAKRIAFVKRWWVMEAPTSHRFCVVHPQRGPIGSEGNEWPDGD